MVRKAAYYNVKTYRSNTRNQHLLHPLIHKRQEYVTIKILHQHEGCISISKKTRGSYARFGTAVTSLTEHYLHTPYYMKDPAT